jgi:hypothetical protein
MYNSAGGYNSDQFNGPGFISDPVDTYSPDQPYILHLRDSSDVYLRKIEGWYNGSWAEKVNDPGKLNFTIPLDGTLAGTGDLVYPNRVWLYDARLRLMRRFVILKTRASANTGTLKVECVGLAYLLKQETVGANTTTGTSTAMRDFLNDLLSSQVNANPIGLGYIAPKYANSLVVRGVKTDKSIWGLLMALWKQFGGIFAIDPEGRLSWYDDAVGNPQHVMTLYEDIETFEEIVDSATVINRVIAKGNIAYDSGTLTHDCVRLPSVYVEDTDSQAIYGIRTKRFKINVESQVELILQATRILNQLKTPQITRNVSAIDLARVQLDPENPIVPNQEYIWAGGKVKIIPPANVPNATPFSVMILSVTRSLDKFLSVKFTVGQGAQPDSPSGRRILNSDTEFFDILAEELDDDTGEDYLEVLYQEDEWLWEAIDGLDFDMPVVGTAGSEIADVAATAVLGSETEKFAPIDHVHSGIRPLVYDAAWTATSSLGDPNEFAIGYLGSAAGSGEGFYLFPPDGSSNADWIPLPSYR